jgi:transcriptional regulator with XRE-family HTH domain
LSVANLLIGERIKRLRQYKGLSRGKIANRLRVDVTAVAAWEQGKYLPRDRHRSALADTLATNVESLFDAHEDPPSLPVSAQLVDTMQDLPGLLPELLGRTHRSVKAVRLTEPCATAAYMQQEFRALLAQRILARSLEVLRVEIFHDLSRLKEALSNMFRYEGCPYHLKAYSPGAAGTVPAMGGYFFDDSEFILGGYWTGVPPHNRPSLRLSGAPVRAFMTAYWDEVWHRGTLLNLRGAHDLEPLRRIAMALGLASDGWTDFVDEARHLDVGDGAPPLV